MNSAAIPLPPVFHTVDEMYPLEGEDLKEIQSRYTNLTQQFEKIYGSAPAYFARAPGRVNLIGEHVDYSGYGVLPMALDRQDTIMAVRVVEGNVQEDTINLHNVSDRFPTRALTASSSIDVAHDWSRYVLAAYRGLEQAKDLVGDDGRGGEEKQTPPQTINILTHGTVPIGSGLSSSSALVCASSLALAQANKQRLSKTQMADLACKAERFIGMESGGMDQAISFLGEKGKAKRIDFDPLRASDVMIPEGVSFVIAASGVEANKYATLGSGYNMRVVECRLAAVLLGKALGIEDWVQIRRLIDVQKLHKPQPSLEDLAGFVKQHLHEEAYSLNELAELTGFDVDRVRKDYLGRIVVEDVNQKVFHLCQRSLHVYTESKRVEDFQAICQTKAASAEEASSQLEVLGKLMNESHFSCRDLFACSCSELDQLTALCREAGAVGSRLTGAGWGGWTISLVPTHKVDAFCTKVKETFPELLVTKPGTGAAVYVPIAH